MLVTVCLWLSYDIDKIASIRSQDLLDQICCLRPRHPQNLDVGEN
jgi:hypothetical protein